MAKKTSKTSTEKMTSSKPSSGAAAKKKPAKPAGAAGSAPAIDTRLTANAAAAFVANRIGMNRGAAATKPESSAFKQLKENLNKPHVQGLKTVLDNSSQVKRSNLPMPGGKQVAQNQTYNADVTRSGVPRRTAG